MSKRIVVVLGDLEVAAVDAHRTRLTMNNPGLSVSFNGALRALLRYHSEMLDIPLSGGTNGTHMPPLSAAYAHQTPPESIVNTTVHQFTAEQEATLRTTGLSEEAIQLIMDASRLDRKDPVAVCKIEDSLRGLNLSQGAIDSILGRKKATPPPAPLTAADFKVYDLANYDPEASDEENLRRGGHL